MIDYTNLMSFTLLETITIILLLALIATLSFRFIRLPAILGYLVVGVLIGPSLLAWRLDLKDIKELADFGLAFLMFTIGLEFSLSKLIVLKKSVFLLGGLQVLCTIIITTFIGLFLKLTLTESIVIGAIAAMSSTAIVVKQLKEQSEINSTHGLNAFGILLFQDLAVIPLLVLFANFSVSETLPFTEILGWSLVKAFLAIAIIFIVGRFMLRPLFQLIAKTRMVEIFTLSVLFVVMGSAWVTHSLGLSYALGTFLAGIMLGETEYKHQINAEIRPFRDVLLGIFFISIGMLANVQLWLQAWIWILLLLTSLMIGKTLLIIFLSRLFNVGMMSSVRTGLVLAQGGEFGFALLSLATANSLLPPDYAQVVLGALLISFALSPIIIHNNKRIAQFFVRKEFITKQDESDDLLYQFIPISISGELTKESLEKNLRSIFLLQNSYANGHIISKLGLHHVEIISIRRGNHHVKPKPDTKLQEGDILILFGLPNYLDEAENRLLVG